jgi:hypothetical protein
VCVCVCLCYRTLFCGVLYEGFDADDSAVLCSLNVVRVLIRILALRFFTHNERVKNLLFFFFFFFFFSG